MLALEKKFEQTIKFQVLVAQYGIALSLSSLQWQMLGECHSSHKKVEFNILPALDRHITRLPTEIFAVYTSSTSGCSRSDPHYWRWHWWWWRWRWWQGLLGDDVDLLLMSVDVGGLILNIMKPPMAPCHSTYMHSTGLPLFHCCSLRTAVNHVKVLCDMTWTR